MPPKACTICDKMQGASDHKDFDIRACAECIEALTISDYRITTDWSLPEDVLQNADIRHSVRKMWARRVGTYRLKFYLREKVLPLIVAHHSAPENTWESVKLVMKQAADLKMQILADRTAVALQLKNDNCLALKIALKERGILIKNANLCPAYKHVFRKNSAPDVCFDVEQVTAAVQFFIIDQPAKSAWLDAWYTSMNVTNPPYYWWEQIYATDALLLIGRIKVDMNCTLAMAKDQIDKWTSEHATNHGQVKVLEQWLRERCVLPEHSNALQMGLGFLANKSFVQSPSASASKSSCFYTFINKPLSTAKIVCAELDNKGYYSLSNSNASTLRTFEKFIVDHLYKYENSYTTFFTTLGIENKFDINDITKSMHIVLHSWWDTVFPVYLPLALKMECFSKMKDETIEPMKIAPKPRTYRERTYECCECGDELQREDVLVSPYHSGTWCESCIEADDDLSGSKWENL